MLALKSRAWELACFVFFLALTGWQLFVSPITGLSDNNDFPKVFGPAHVCAAPPGNLNAWFVSSYDAGPRCHWPSGFASTEILLVDIARYLGRPFTGRYRFDLRASAAVHLAILALAMVLFLRLSWRQRPLVRIALPALAILIFSDVAYVAYLNSAYMDNASWVLLLLLVSIAAFAAQHSTAQWTPIAYAIAGVLLLFSKAQHALLGIPFAGLAFWYAFRDRRAMWTIAAAALVVSAAVDAVAYSRRLSRHFDL